MPVRTPNTRDEQDAAYSPFDSDYSSKGLSDLEQQGDTPAATERDGASGSAADDVNNLENDSATGNQFGFERSSSESSSGTLSSGGRFSRIRGYFKGNLKRQGAGIGVLAGVGLGGTALFSFFGPASLLISLGQNLAHQNDTSSTAMERRFAKVFGKMTQKDDPLCKSSKKIKCKVGRISNRAIRSLDKKGIVAYDESGKKIPIKRTGYPDKNPARYGFETGEVDKAGKPKYKFVNAGDVRGFLGQKENARLAARVLGVGGAFNLRVSSAMGKFMKKRVFDPFGIKRDGGNANGKNKTLDDVKKSHKERLESSASEEKRSKLVEGLSEKTKSRVGKFAKGGIPYQIAAAGCIGVKLPGMFAGAVAAYQLMQVMPTAMDYILSPSTKAQASGIDPKNAITPEEADVAGSALTERVDNGNGKASSALDSQYLLAALGANKGQVPVSKKFTPGYAIMMSGVVKSSVKLKNATKDQCNMILSPAAMYSAMVADAAITVALSATVIGGVAKAAGQIALSFIIVEGIEKVIEKYSGTVLELAAKNNDIPDAKGEELGDVIGIGAMSFFSTSAITHGLPVLKNSQVAAFEKVKQENEAYQRQLAVASLSPFDTSSQYTFMGSLLSNANLSFAKNASALDSVASIIKTPFSMLSSIVGKQAHADYVDATTYCGYAKDFDMEAGENTPAINVAGLPCTGITPEQSNMSTDEAIDLLAKEGWLDKNKDIEEGATIDDLLESGVIKGSDSDTNPLRSFVEDCTHAAEAGTYLLDSPSCTVQDKSGGASRNIPYANDDGAQQNGSIDISNIDPRSQSAISVFLLDFQIAQSLNGEDDEESGDNQGASSGEESSDGTVDGDAKELAQKLLDYAKSGKVKFWDQARDAGDKSRPSDNLRSIANGELAHTSKRGPAGGKTTTIDVNLLKFLVDLAGETPIMINALVGQAHSANSNHYKGKAVDFNCSPSIPLAKADSIAKKYGVKRNFENCAQHSHWHYSTNGR